MVIQKLYSTASESSRPTRVTRVDQLVNQMTELGLPKENHAEWSGSKTL